MIILQTGSRGRQTAQPRKARCQAEAIPSTFHQHDSVLHICTGADADVSRDRKRLHEGGGEPGTHTSGRSRIGHRSTGNTLEGPGFFSCKIDPQAPRAMFTPVRAIGIRSNPAERVMSRGIAEQIVRSALPPWRTKAVKSLHSNPAVKQEAFSHCSRVGECVRYQPPLG